ncbi:MAG: ABC transporter ATP-binding protein [Vicinamibacterales bacterium]
MARPREGLDVPDDIVICEGVSKVYRSGTVDVQALTDIDLRIRPGEFTTLIGPSGSGKSTLLNLIGGLDRPTAGHIRVDGRPIDELSPAELADLRLARIGFVFQAYNLVPVLTARENVELIMELQGEGASRRAAASAAVLADVGLSELADRRPAALSGGQQQRVAVARAIASRPAIVLADEPTANLDSHTAADLLRTMKSLNDTRGITFLISTHDSRVMEFARRLVTLRDGRIAEDRERA